MTAEPFDKKPTSNRAYLIATAVLLALLAMTLLFYAFGIRNYRSSSENRNSEDLTNTTNGIPTTATAPPPAPVEPSVVLSRTGNITEVKKNDLRFTPPVYNASREIYEAQEIRVIVNDDTRIQEVDRRTALPIPAPGQPAPQEPTRDIQLKDLKAGDTVEVFSNDNMKGKTEVTASLIQRILLP